MKNPFKKLVGLRGVSVAETYVNDLPGLSTELVEALATDSDNEDGEPVLMVWERILSAANYRLEAELLCNLATDSTFNSQIAETLPSYPDLGGNDLEPIGKFVGLVLSSPIVPDSRLVVETLSLISVTETQVSATVKVQYGSKEVVSVPVTIEPGINEISLMAKVEFPRLATTPYVFVGIDATGLTLRPIERGGWNTSGYSYLPATMGQYLVAVGNELEPAYIAVDAKHQRTLSSVISAYADQLRLPYLYLCGSLLMSEKLGTTNFNLFTNTNRDFTIEQEEKLMKDFTTSVKQVARLIKQNVANTGNLKPASDTESGYSNKSFV